jgi:hypothetical protein
MKLRYLMAFMSLATVMVLLSINTGPSLAEDIPAILKRTYNPVVSYPGKFENSVLYFRNSNKSNWMRGEISRFPDAVSCHDAIVHINRTGLWKGHFKSDGSCGPTGEPTDWALGNRLNYEAAMQQE